MGDLRSLLAFAAPHRGMLALRDALRYVKARRSRRRAAALRLSRNVPPVRTLARKARRTKQWIENKC